MLGAQRDLVVSSPPPAPQPATLSQMERHASSALPYKHAVPYVTPVKHQLLRGACWLFSTVGVLEASYRKQGAEKGYLGAHEYLKLSEQAYGAVMARVCKENPACETGDADETWMGNTTEGGEAEWLYYLQKTVATTAAVPYSVCPYTQPPTPDTECAGAAAAAAPSARRSETIPSPAAVYDNWPTRAIASVSRCRSAASRGEKIAASSRLLIRVRGCDRRTSCTTRSAIGSLTGVGELRRSSFE